MNTIATFIVVVSLLNLLLNLANVVSFVFLAFHHKEAAKQDALLITEAINNINSKLDHIGVSLTRNISSDVNRGFAAQVSDWRFLLNNASYLTKPDIDKLIKRLVSPHHYVQQIMQH
jgi:hypothetical protein